jgi:CIC family chloride channel protein
MVCEMAGSYDLLVPLMLAEGIAFVALRNHTLYSAQVATKQDSPSHRPPEVLRGIKVQGVLISDRPYVAFTPETPMSQVIQEVAQTSWQDVFPVLEQGKLVGIITSEMLRIFVAERDIESWTLAVDAMQPPLTAQCDDDLRQVSERMVEQGLREVPVVDDDGHIIGFLDEAEIAHTYLEATRPKPS